MIQDNRENFNRLNKIGKIGEDKFEAWLVGKDLEILHRSYGKAPEWDIAFRNQDGDIRTAEVKTDTATSPNLALEIFSRNKVSGICSGSADWYVIYSTQDNAFYMAKRSELLQLTQTHPQLFKSRKNMRNDSGTYVFLINKQDFIQHFRKVTL